VPLNAARTNTKARLVRRFTRDLVFANCTLRASARATLVASELRRCRSCSTDSRDRCGRPIARDAHRTLSPTPKQVWLEVVAPVERTFADKTALSFERDFTSERPTLGQFGIDTLG
jgi:hypothetical protein